MPRQLVLDGQVRRHPFRHYARRQAALVRKARDDGDFKLFALSFSAFFVCFTTFIL